MSNHYGSHDDYSETCNGLASNRALFLRGSLTEPDATAETPTATTYDTAWSEATTKESKQSFRGSDERVQTAFPYSKLHPDPTFSNFDSTTASTLGNGKYQDSFDWRHANAVRSGFVKGSGHSSEGKIEEGENGSDVNFVHSASLGSNIYPSRPSEKGRYPHRLSDVEEDDDRPSTGDIASGDKEFSRRLSTSDPGDRTNAASGGLRRCHAFRRLRAVSRPLEPSGGSLSDLSAAVDSQGNTANTARFGTEPVVVTPRRPTRHSSPAPSSQMGFESFNFSEVPTLDLTFPDDISKSGRADSRHSETQKRDIRGRRSDKFRSSRSSCTRRKNTYSRFHPSRGDEPITGVDGESSSTDWTSHSGRQSETEVSGSEESWHSTQRPPGASGKPFDALRDNISQWKGTLQSKSQTLESALQWGLTKAETTVKAGLRRGFTKAKNTLRSWRTDEEASISTCPWLGPIRKQYWRDGDRLEEFLTSKRTEDAQTIKRNQNQLRSFFDDHKGRLASLLPYFTDEQLTQGLTNERGFTTLGDTELCMGLAVSEREFAKQDPAVKHYHSDDDGLTAQHTEFDYWNRENDADKSWRTQFTETEGIDLEKQRDLLKSCNEEAERKTKTRSEEGEGTT